MKATHINKESDKKRTPLKNAKTAENDDVKTGKNEPEITKNQMSEIVNRIDNTYDRFQRLSLNSGKDSSHLNDLSKKTLEEEKKVLIDEITKMKNDLAAAVNAKSEFLSVISHEIRTPMNAVIGMSGLLMDTNLTPEQKEYVDTIRSSGDKLLTLINDILDYTDIDSGKLALEYQPFSLRNCIDDAIGLISNSAWSKSLEVIYYVDPQVPENIFGDITRLRQIIVNLLNNAVKFTNQGDVFLSVVKIDKPGKTSDDIELEFSIRDTGIGIKNTEAEKIFKEFSQVDSSLTRKFGGAGLGLAICKKLVDMMGGNIWFESKEGIGTTFYFTISVKKSEVTEVKEYLLSDIPNLKGKNLLIIDENRVLRQILSLQTQMWGMKPKTTPSGYEAIDWLKKYKFDTVLLDLVLNEKYNGEIVKEIRRVKGNEFPIIALQSGKSDMFVNQDLFSASITKPINQEELFDVFNLMCTDNKTSIVKPEVTEKKLSEKLPLKILIAEDNIINQKIASRILAQMGYVADIASDGLEVLDCLNRQHYDLVLMDVQMPELDGIQTTGRILEKWIPAERPKIIAMTANATQGDMEKCLYAGMDDFISKPILSEELKTMLEKWGSNPITKVTGALTYNNDDLIDTSTVENLKQITGIDNLSFLKEVVNLYSKQTPQLISDIKKHWKNNEIQKLILAVHNLRGSSINMGAKLIQEISKNIEAKCRKGDMGEIGNDIEKLEYVYQRTINEYKKLV
ncbi:MAG: response regulator [Bacteroidetes bacterium]|nr:response regulator [Bacteroidota bacterium]